MRNNFLEVDNFCKKIYENNIAAGWWLRGPDGVVADRNMGELLALIHSEVSEALEGDRKGLQDDKLPQYPMVVVELVDVLIRTFDLLGHLSQKNNINISEVISAKMAYNQNRADHKPVNRAGVGGKKY